MIEQLEVAGVPTFFARQTGKTAAGLTFRVGQADETLARRGITHLVEHLALFRLGLTDYHSNGATGATLTHFYLEGREANVVAFLESVCASLTDLPLDRLARERDILATEQAGRSRPALPLWRYGAQGYGLAGYPEWGVDRLRADDVAEWSRTWFTKENAALWVAGERIPPELSLALPAGERRPCPRPSTALDATPAWFPGGQGQLVLNAVVRRSAAASAYASVLGRELWRILRQEGGYSYTTGADYEPRDGQFAEITAFADAHPDKEDAVVGAFLELMATFKAGRISEESVAAARARAQERFDHPELEAQLVATHASDFLRGGRLETVEELRAEAAAVTLADVQAVAKAVHADALLMVPHGHAADWAGFAAAPTFSRHTIPGQAYRAIENPDVELVVGRDGVSLRTDDGPLTVRFDQCAARLDWPDGRRVLIGADGISVTVEPTLFRLDDVGRRGLDARLDPGLVIKRPPRQPHEIPQPEPPEIPAARSPRSTSPPATTAEDPDLPRPKRTLLPPPQFDQRAQKRTPREWVHFALLRGSAILTAFMVMIGIVSIFDSVQAPEEEGNDWGTTAAVWFIALVVAAPLIRAGYRRMKS